jgi:hypothetical protein
VHIRDDALTGIVILPAAAPHPSKRSDYFEAWLVIRAALDQAQVRSRRTASG